MSKRFELSIVFAKGDVCFGVKDKRDGGRVIAKFCGPGSYEKAKRRVSDENLNDDRKGPRRDKPPGESGNVFFALFAAVAMVGFLATATTNIMRGPVSSMVAVNHKTQADTNLSLAGRMAAMESVTVGLDCDGDGIKEPLPPETGAMCTDQEAAGGGCLPPVVGANQQDPWGTPVMYCAYNHGSNGPGCSSALRNGEASPAGKIVLAVVSAGPDRVFDTICADAPGYVTKGGDDIVHLFDETQAREFGASGLWSLKSGDDTVATIDKDLAIETEASFAAPVTFAPTASLTLGGNFLLPSDSAMTICNVANKGALRVRDADNKLQICDGAGNWPLVGASTFTELLDTPANYAGAASRFLRVNAGANAIEYGGAAWGDLLDAPAFGPAHANQWLRVSGDGSALLFSSSAFLELSDTPNAFTGAAGRFLRVNAAADAVAFSSASLLDLSDTPDSFSGAAGRFLRVNATTDGVRFASASTSDLANWPASGDGFLLSQGGALSFASAGALASILEPELDLAGSFLDLDDTPNAFTGQAGKVVKVNPGANGLIFADDAEGAHTFVGLNDTPNNYTGHDGKLVRVKTGGGLEFFDPTIEETVGSCGASWTAGTGAAGSFMAMTYGGSRFVAVNYEGTAYWSTNGASWTAGTGTTGVLRAVTYGGGRFVVVSDNGAAYHSTDGASWTAGTGTAGYLRAVTYGGGRFVAVSSNGTAYHSTDGASWTAGTGTAGNLRAVTYGGGRFVAVNSSGAAYYSDCTTSPPLIGDAPETFLDLDDTPNAFTGQAGKVVKVNAGATALEFADDQGAVKFISLTDTPANYSGAGGKIVAVRDDETGVEFIDAPGGPAPATCGENWTAGTGTTGTLVDVAFGGGRFVIVENDRRTFWSADGQTWTAGAVFSGSGNPAGVAYGGGRFVATGWNIGHYSTDGATWTAASGLPAGTSVREPVYSNGRFVAAASNGSVYYSADGASWTAASGTSGNLQARIAVGEANQLVVANGSGGAFYSSNNGTSWAAASGISGAIVGVAYGGGRFVATSTTGSVFYSTNGGASWTAGSGITGATRRLAYGNGRFVAVNDTGGRFWSTDGASWTAGTGAAVSGSQPPVIFAQDRFIVAGSLGAVWSLDGAVWTAATGAGGGAGQNARAIAVANGKAVIVKDNGVAHWADCTLGGGSGGAETFLDLDDTPSSYAGQGGRYVRVNAGATALEFTTAPTAPLPSLECVEQNYTGGYNNTAAPASVSCGGTTCASGWSLTGRQYTATAPAWNNATCVRHCCRIQ